MGISKFMILLIMLTVAFLFVEKDYLVQSITKEKKPRVSFVDSTMYEISETRVNQIVKSKQADIYKNKEELTDATIIAKVNENNYDTNIASSQNMLKIGDKIVLNNNVNLQLSNGVNIKTEQLYYNLKTQIAHNKVPFVVTRGSDTFIGNSLFINSVTEELKAKNTKFRMKVENNE
jgi:LPS export ABC transporter protein LptC